MIIFTELVPLSDLTDAVCSLFPGYVDIMLASPFDFVMQCELRWGEMSQLLCHLALEKRFLHPASRLWGWCHQSTLRLHGKMLGNYQSSCWIFLTCGLRLLFHKFDISVSRNNGSHGESYSSQLLKQSGSPSYTTRTSMVPYRLGICASVACHIQTVGKQKRGIEEKRF